MTNVTAAACLCVWKPCVPYLPKWSLWGSLQSRLLGLLGDFAPETSAHTDSVGIGIVWRQ